MRFLFPKPSYCCFIQYVATDQYIFSTKMGIPRHSFYRNSMLMHGTSICVPSIYTAEKPSLRVPHVYSL